MCIPSLKRLAAHVALLTGCGLSVQSAAFQPLVTDDTGTQGRAGNQFEVSLNFDRAKAAGDIDRIRTTTLVYTRGLTETIDGFAGLGHIRVRPSAREGDASGASNPLFGLKWRFYENQATLTSIALKPEVLLPVSAGRERAGLGNGRTSGAVTLILTQEVPFGAIHANAGGRRDRYRDASNNPDTTSRRVSIAPVWDLDAQWKLAADLGMESARAAGARARSRFIELGAIYSPGKDRDFAFGILRASNDGQPRVKTYTITMGVTWRFP